MKKHLKAFLLFSLSCLLFSNLCWADGVLRLETRIDHNWISGYSFPIETQVDVTINGGEKAEFSVLTDSFGHFVAHGSQHWQDQRITCGDVFELSYGDQTVSMTVQDINAELDLEKDPPSLWQKYSDCRTIPRIKS